MQKQRTDPSGAYQTLIVIWFALLFSQILFLVLVYFIRPELVRLDLSRPLLGQNAIVILLMAGLAVIDLAVSFIMRKQYIAEAIGRQDVGILVTALIIGCALCEAISLCGLLLAFAFNYPYFWLFSALGIFGTILHFPRKSNVEAATFRSQI